ncbi:MAG: HEAT repeat domain-containing protein [Verrucomicrobiales bacterium]|nr:HEAT repeat domain-containing protein [Verrucomicrobiales bacterium]
MKTPILMLTLTGLLSTFGLSADLSGGGKDDEAANILTSEEYDKEAAVRISSFTLPDDVTASLYADPGQIKNPSAICFDQNGDLFVAEINRWRAGVQDIRNEQQILLDDINNETSQDRYEMYERDQLTRPLSFYTDYEDRIVKVRDSDKDGRADDSSVWADGFNDVLDGPGIGLVSGYDNDIFYTNIPHLWYLKDTDNDGKADKQESLQDGFGVRMSISGHDMHGVIWGPDGKLYWSIGDRGYNFTTKEGRNLNRNYEGAVFRCDPDGSNLEEVYRGLRNPQELAFDRYGNLFTCDNDADQWDKGRLVYILEGGDAGWNHGHQVILNFRNQLELRTPDYEHPDHKKIPLNPWMTEAIWEPLHPERPAYALPPVDIVSWGPSGMVYNYGATAMPQRYDNHFWICNFGGAKGDLEAFSVNPEGAGFSLDHHEIFMVGLGNTDVEFGPDGRMYLSCFNNNGWYKQDIGNIYALEDKNSARTELIKETEEIIAKDFSALVETEVAPLLGHADMRVRMRAQFELVKRSAVAVFEKAIKVENGQLERLHGVWGLGQLSRNDEALLSHHIDLLNDGDIEVRSQAAKVLGDSRTPEAGLALLATLDDDSARVQSFAAIGVGKCGEATALPKLIEILATNSNADVFLRHACVQGMWGLNEREKMLKETKNESAAVRLGILLTLRKLEDPRVKYFLNDDDNFIRDEAVRAINDLDLTTALPDLAKVIDPLITGAEGSVFPEGHRDWIIQTRIINANFRVGAPENAARLLKYAAQTKLPALLREQALHAILEWKEPTSVDSTNGFYRPLDPASRVDITAAVEANLPAVFEIADGNLIGLATEIALEYGVEAPVELLTQQITDEKAEVAARIKSMNGLAGQDAGAMSGLWDKLLKSKDSVFKGAVVAQLLDIDKDRGVKEAVKLANSGDLKERQEGYALLGGVSAPEATTLFQERLAAMTSEKPGALLDLLEGAALKKAEDEKIASLLADYEASLDPTDPSAAFRPAMKGGNVARGREIFATHAIGQCSKCHKVNGDGGVAGPDMTGIGSRHDHKYLLESLVDPSAYVVPGYGMMLMTLKNGDSVGGAFVEETGEAVILKIPDPEDSAKQIEKAVPLSEIASRQPPVSAMPPMGLMMKKSEIRDLVAYLASLKEKKGKKGH